MKIRNKSYKGSPVLDLPVVLTEMVEGGSYYEGGELETLRHEVRTLQEVLIRFMCSQIKTVEQVNDLYGYDCYEEVEE